MGGYDDSQKNDILHLVSCFFALTAPPVSVIITSSRYNAYLNKRAASLHGIQWEKQSTSVAESYIFPVLCTATSCLLTALFILPGILHAFACITIFERIKMERNFHKLRVPEDEEKNALLKNELIWRILFILSFLCPPVLLMFSLQHLWTTPSAQIAMFASATLMIFGFLPGYLPLLVICCLASCQTKTQLT